MPEKCGCTGMDFNHATKKDVPFGSSIPDLRALVDIFSVKIVESSLTGYPTKHDESVYHLNQNPLCV